MAIIAHMALLPLKIKLLVSLWAKRAENRRLWPVQCHFFAVTAAKHRPRRHDNLSWHGESRITFPENAFSTGETGPRLESAEPRSNESSLDQADKWEPSR